MRIETFLSTFYLCIVAIVVTMDLVHPPTRSLWIYAVLFPGTLFLWHIERYYYTKDRAYDFAKALTQ